MTNKTHVRGHKRDRRQINEVWSFKNPKGVWYIFGRVGSGKNAYIKTLASGKTEKQAWSMYEAKKHGMIIKDGYPI